MKRLFSLFAVIIISVMSVRAQTNGRNSQTSDLIFTVNGVSFTMVFVEGGTYTMGATNEQDRYERDERPVHSVTLSNYMIGQTEVTQALWMAVMGGNPSFFRGDIRLPVEEVSWNDCQAFINKLNALTGERFRLPTEAEWEFAARGGNISKGYKYSGSNTLSNVAWYWKNSGDYLLLGTDSDWEPSYVMRNKSKTHLVGLKSPNELGIYDMSGNVWEWCNDWYDTYSSVDQLNPQGPLSGSTRVYRGGSWAGEMNYCRVSLRNDLKPDIRNGDLGFRLAL